MPFPPPPPDKKGSWLSRKNLQKLRWPALAATILGGPYAYYESGDWGQSLTTTWQEWTAHSNHQASPIPLATGQPGMVRGQFGAMASGANAPTALPEIFRFDVSPAWVTGSWPEVSLGMADVALTGHRVMLVTGSRPEDLAGSLTYYFDRDQRLQRIRFTGVTGDPRPLVADMATRYRFVRCRADVPGTEVYQVHRDGKAAGDLRVRSASVVRSDSPLGRYHVSLAIDRPTE